MGMRYPAAALFGSPKNPSVAMWLTESQHKTYTLQEAEVWVRSFPALKDGELSYEALLNAIANALKAKHQADCADAIAANTHSYACCYTPVVTFGDSLVYENNGEFYLCSYKVNGTIKEGITSEQAKKITKIIRDDGPKGVKAQIQGDEIRVSSKKRDDLQTVISLLKQADLEVALQFVNYR